MNPALDWVVVGGGLQGCHLAAVLLDSGIARDRLAIVDASSEPLGAWTRRRRATGMKFLRSPVVHHLGLDPFGLRRWARRGSYRGRPAFSQPYNRPSVELFEAHSMAVAEDLEDRVRRAKVLGFDLVPRGVRIRTTDGELLSRRVLLALGPGQRRRPELWSDIPHDLAHHVFSRSVESALPGREVVVGGGITAVQVALARLELGAAVTILARHSMRVYQFDSDPGWLGPKFLTGFRREPDRTARRELIQAARHRGSVPPALARKARSAIREDRLTWAVGEAVEAPWTAATGVEVRTRGSEVLPADHVHLCTGFHSGIASHRWLQKTQARLELPVSECGNPVLDETLRWHPRIHVAGNLADLELGPAAGNIAGARMAGERLRGFIQSSARPRRVRLATSFAANSPARKRYRRAG